tara:strand:+ start:2075 stop:2779 length:705 start_codon:yes stop_codon:yes gene_type:complete
MKETRRKGFNFYRSYYDVYNELEDADKLTFIEALLNKQFLDIDPDNLKGMTKFAWISQYNSIDQQVKGYKSKTKDPMQGGEVGGGLRGDLTPCLQEKEKGKEKGKEKEKQQQQDGVYKSVEVIVEDYKNNERIIEAVLKNGQQLAFSKEDLFLKLEDFVLHLESTGDIVKQEKEFKSHFLNWLRVKKKLSLEKSTKPTPAEKVFGAYFEEANTIAKQLNNLTILKDEENKRIGG